MAPLSHTHSLTHSGPRVPKVAHGASVRVLHCCRSSAHRLAVSRLRSHSFSSLAIVLHQVTLGLPLLCLPWGVHLNATLGSESVSIRRTWPSHLHLLFLATTESGSRLQDVSRSLLLFLFGQKIRLMHRPETFSLEYITFPGDFPVHLPAFTSVQQDRQHIALVNFDLGLHI